MRKLRIQEDIRVSRPRERENQDRRIYPIQSGYVLKISILSTSVRSVLSIILSCCLVQWAHSAPLRLHKTVRRMGGSSRTPRAFELMLRTTKEHATNSVHLANTADRLLLWAHRQRLSSNQFDPLSTPGCTKPSHPLQ